MLAKVHYYLEAWLEKRMNFQAHLQCWHNSFPDGYMTECPGFLLAILSRGCP